VSSNTHLETIEALGLEALCLAASPELRQELGIAVEHIGSARLVTCRALDHGQVNRVIGLGVQEPLSEAAIDQAIEAFASHGIGNFYLQIRPDAEPPELPAWLAKRGLVAHSRRWAKFGRGRTPPAATRTDLRVEAIERVHAEAFGKIVTTSFGMPAVMSPWLASVVGNPGWSVYLAFDGELPVAAGAMFTHEQVAWLLFGATLTSHRGRGAQGAILSRRIADAIACGAEQLVVETGEAVPGQPQTSYANILKSGFELVYSRANYTRA
jgi:hypothetical protein